MGLAISDKRRLARRLVLPITLVFMGCLILISLGNWQLQRLDWKLELIEQVALRPLLTPESLPPLTDWQELNISELEYRPYRVEGRFDYGNEALVFTSLPDPKGPFGGPGYWVLTPLRLKSGGVVFVNRGFVPHGREGVNERSQIAADQDVTLVGLLRRVDPGGRFRPDDQPQENRFHVRNPITIAQAKAMGGEVAPFTLDALADLTPPGGLPQAGESRTVFRNNHLDYALTWYGLAVALVGVFAVYAWRQIKGTQSQSSQNLDGKPGEHHGPSHDEEA